MMVLIWAIDFLTSLILIGFSNCPVANWNLKLNNSALRSFNLTFKSHYKEDIHLEVWVEGHEETKKMLRLVDIYAG